MRKEGLANNTHLFCLQAMWQKHNLTLPPQNKSTTKIVQQPKDWSLQGEKIWFLTKCFETSLPVS